MPSGPYIPLLDSDNSNLKNRHNGTLYFSTLSTSDALHLAKSVHNESDNWNSIVEISDNLPGNIVALGLLPSSNLKQLIKPSSSIQVNVTNILFHSLNEIQKRCAYCLSPLLHLNAFASEECYWYLCEEAFGGNKALWSEAMNGLEKIGWIKSSLYCEDFIVLGDELPPKVDGVPTLLKQSFRYCEYWAKQLCHIYISYEENNKTISSMFHFDRYRSHYDRLISCWQQANESNIVKYKSSLLTSYGVLGSNYARDIAISVAGKISIFYSIRLCSAECVDICCDVYSIIEKYDKRCVAYLQASMDLCRMLLLNNQLFDGLELSTELVTGIKDCISESNNQYHYLLGVSRSILSAIYEGLGQNENAIICYNQSIDSLGIFYGLDSRQYAIAEHSLGHVHRFINDFKKAEVCYNKALECFKTCHGNNIDHSDVACVINDMAGIYKTRDNYEKTYELLIEVIRIRKKVLGSEHIETGHSLNNLAVFLHSQNKYEEALVYYQDALVIYKALLGEYHVDVASAMSNLGGLYDDMGDYLEAKSFYEKSLVIRRAILDDNHPDLAACLGSLAALLDDNGEISAAKELYIETLQVLRNIYGETHDDVASTLVNIAVLEDEEGNLTLAKQLYEEALDIFIEIYSENDDNVASTLICIINVAKAQFDHNTVQVCYNRVIDIYKELHGLQSIEVSNAMSALGVYLYKAGARHTSEDVVSNTEDKNLKTPPNTSHTTNQLYEKSSQLLEEALRIRKKLLGPMHIDII